VERDREHPPRQHPEPTCQEHSGIEPHAPENRTNAKLSARRTGSALSLERCLRPG
jgi:hypothetical protein